MANLNNLVVNGPAKFLQGIQGPGTEGLQYLTSETKTNQYIDYPSHMSGKSVLIEGMPFPYLVNDGKLGLKAGNTYTMTISDFNGNIIEEWDDVAEANEDFPGAVAFDEYIYDGVIGYDEDEGLLTGDGHMFIPKSFLMDWDGDYNVGHGYKVTLSGTDSSGKAFTSTTVIGEKIPDTNMPDSLKAVCNPDIDFTCLGRIINYQETAYIDTPLPWKVNYVNSKNQSKTADGTMAGFFVPKSFNFKIGTNYTSVLSDTWGHPITSFSDNLAYDNRDFPGTTCIFSDASKMGGIRIVDGVTFNPLTKTWGPGEGALISPMLFLDFMLMEDAPYSDMGTQLANAGYPSRGKVCITVYGEDKFGNQLTTDFKNSNYLHTNIDGYATNLLGLNRSAWHLNFEGGQNYKHNPVLGECFNIYFGNFGMGMASHAEGYESMAWGTGSHAEGGGHKQEISESYEVEWESKDRVIYSGPKSDFILIDHDDGVFETVNYLDVCKGVQLDGTPLMISSYSEDSSNNTVTITFEEQIPLSEGDTGYLTFHAGAYGDCSHVEGITTMTFGDASHTGGEICAAFGNNEFVHGYSNFATGESSAAVGAHLRANGYGQVVVGKYNTAYAGPTSESATTGTLFIVGKGTSSSARSNALRVVADGSVLGTKSYTSSGADYAEYYEWSDGNINGEDRRGRFVTFDDGNKIRIANNSDDYILGVISADPSVIGNGYTDEWQGMYLTDVYGQRLTEIVEIPEQIIKDEVGDIIKIIPAHTETQFVINPDYDASKKYVGRDERQEWTIVGTHGQLVVVDDGTCQVNSYCKVSDGGIATKSSEKTEYRIVERLDDTHIRIVIR